MFTTPFVSFLLIVNSNRTQNLYVFIQCLFLILPLFSTLNTQAAHYSFSSIQFSSVLASSALVLSSHSGFFFSVGDHLTSLWKTTIFPVMRIDNSFALYISGMKGQLLGKKHEIRSSREKSNRCFPSYHFNYWLKQTLIHNPVVLTMVIIIIKNKAIVDNSQYARKYANIYYIYDLISISNNTMRRFHYYQLCFPEYDNKYGGVK